MSPHGKRIRLLYLISPLATGGAERALLQLLRKLDRSRFEPELCVMSPEGDLLDQARALDLPLHVLDGLWRFELRGPKLLPILAHFRPHIVHSRLVVPNIWARLMGRGFGAKVVVEERGVENFRHPVMAAANRLTAPLSTVAVGNSAAVVEKMRIQDGISPSRLRLIAGGVDAQRFTPAPAGTQPRYDVLSLSLLYDFKGAPELMELCLLLAKARPEVRIAIAGTGPLLSAFQAFVREHRLERSVDLLGLCADPAPLLHQSRIVVSTSHEEGLPNAIMEAMASGLPVVATDIPGHQDLILNGVSGALVPPRRPELLVPAILGYLDDTRLAAAHGQSGRSRVVERFSLDAVVRQYEALYEELVRA